MNALDYEAKQSTQLKSEPDSTKRGWRISAEKNLFIFNLCAKNCWKPEVLVQNLLRDVCFKPKIIVGSGGKFCRGCYAQ